MSAPHPDGTARPRRSRTRSRTVSARPALALSTLRPHQFDLRPACASLICPDCKTWVPITGLQSKKPKLVPHDTGRAGWDAAVRCQGSNRLLTLNVTVRTWETRLTDGNADTAHRRSGRVVRKPETRPAPAVTQITDAVMDDRKARQLVEAHLSVCAICCPGLRKSEQQGKWVANRPAAARCADGRRLAGLAAHAKRAAPGRRQWQMQDEELADGEVHRLRLLRRASWEATDRDVRETNARRAWLPAGDEPLGAPPVPLEKLRAERPTR